MNLKQFWHKVSNVRPIVWISLYVCLIPLFAVFYWLLPPGNFRIPEGGDEGFGGWLYYSIVTITTLGFGDYTPAHAAAQWVTAIEVMCGLVTIGFFLNAVGSMKSDIEVETELEKQHKLHEAAQTEKLIKNSPVCIHKLNTFLEYCYAVTTPLSFRKERLSYNPEFAEDDMQDMLRPSGLADDHSTRPAIDSLMACSASTCLFLDSLQARIDLSLWPQLLEDCFAFVANFQMLTVEKSYETPTLELVHFIRTNAALARDIQSHLTSIAALYPRMHTPL